MRTQIWTHVDAYLNERFVGSDSVLSAALQAADAGGLPSIQVSPTQGKFLMLLARSIAARRILEIGALGGYSTIWLARALSVGGRLISCELNPAYAEVARVNVRNAGLGELVEIRIGPAIDTLAKLADERAEPFDLVFIDANKSGYPDYLAAVLKLVRAGTLILADNVVREGRLIDPSRADADMRGVRRFLDMLAAEPCLSATALQTVGEKGYDGFSLALVCCNP